jgi:hypothetical protein
MSPTETMGPGLTTPLDARSARHVLWLAAATAACALFAPIHYEPLRLVTVSTTVAVILVLAGVLAAVGGRTRRTAVVVAVGAVLVLLGLYRLVTYGHGGAGIGGAASTAALLTGLGLAHLGLAVGRR